MATSTSLKALGNSAYSAQDFQTAIKHYTDALKLLELVPPAKDDAIDGLEGDTGAEKIGEEAALRSNRAACWIMLGGFDRAILDASKAHKLSPTWSKPLARRAEAWSGLWRFDEAEEDYKKAIDLSSTEPTTQTRLKTTLSTLLTRRITLLAPQPPINYSTRISKLEASGTHNFIEGGSAELVLRAWGWVEEGMKDVDKDVWRNEVGNDGRGEDKFGSKVPSGILKIVDGILLDSKSFHIPPGRTDPDFPLAEKLRLQFLYDVQVFQNEPFVAGVAKGGEEVIKTMRERVEKEGWGRVRPALSHLIRGQVLMGFIEEATGAYDSAIFKYRHSLSILEAGIESLSPEERGATFGTTFRRGVMIFLMLALMEKWAREGSKEADESLAEVLALGELVMDDCIANPVKVSAEEPTDWLACQILPLVNAAKSIAFVLSQRSRFTSNTSIVDIVIPTPTSPSSNRKVLYYHPQMNLAASRMYAQAFNYLPLDDPEKGVCAFLGLSCSLRSGGHSIGEILDRAREAEGSCGASEPVFGPVPRSFDARTLVRKVCDVLREFVQREGECVLERKVAPVGSVAKMGEGEVNEVGVIVDTGAKEGSEVVVVEFL
ncbi:hypothetical protein T439DRAFT_327094 [Meredithblackwellia eburnea MCA 4105]